MSYYNAVYYAGESKSKKRLKAVDAKVVADMLCLAATVLYVLQMSFDTTLFRLPWPPRYLLLVRVPACAAILLKAGYEKAYAGKRWLLCILSFLVFKYSWLSTGYNFLLDTALLAASAVGVPYRKLLKAGFWTGLYVLLVAMMGSFTGCIKDLVYLDEGLFKHSFGIVYPTDFAAHVVFLFLTGWVLYGKMYPLLSAACSLILCVLVYHFSGARCSSIILFLTTIGIIYTFWAQRDKGHSLLPNRILGCIDVFLIYVTPLCTLFMTLLVFLYNPESKALNFINQALSNRLSLSRAAMDKYGITLFGTPFSQIGYGGTTAWSWAMDYTFVDSSYMLILLRYGVIALLAICFLSVMIGKKSLVHKRREVTMAMALVAVHSMIEHHLPEAAYNFFLLLPFADLSDEGTEETEASSGLNMRCASYIAILSAGITMSVLLALLPRFVTYMKTIVDTLHLDEPQKHITFITVIFLFLLWVALFIHLAFIVAKIFFLKTALPMIVPVSVALLLTVPCIALAIGEQVIQQGQDDYQMLLEADTPILETLLAEGGGGRLYVDHVPELYKRRFPDISNQVLSSEGLAGKESVTLITEVREELAVLMSAGYSYGELPSGHAIYTDDADAQSRLESLDIRMEPYYSHRTVLNLQDVAMWNGLQVTDEGTLLLSGSGQSLLHGPWCTIYKGILEVQYTLKLLTPLPEGTVAATVQIFSDGGLYIWKQQDILSSDFDVSGDCIYLVSQKLPHNCPNMEFRLLIPDGVELELLGITYGKQGAL